MDKLKKYGGNIILCPICKKPISASADECKRGVIWYHTKCHNKVLGYGGDYYIPEDEDEPAPIKVEKPKTKRKTNAKDDKGKSHTSNSRGISRGRKALF